ncbi:MAG: hypothetical protein WCG06_03690, partial [Candidatus Omnitrophota bacterium]
MQDFVWAAPNSLEIKPLDLRFFANDKEWAKRLMVDIPRSVAVVEDAYQAPADKGLIFLVQDAHTNISCQLNTARLLDLLMDKQPLGHVFVEAGTGDLSLAFLKARSSPETRSQTAQAYLSRGQLQGTELANLTSGHDFVLYGAEDKGLYRQALEAYRAVLLKRPALSAYLANIDSTIRTLEPKVLNPFLQRLEGKRASYKNQEMPPTDYADYLIREAAALGVE